MVTGGELSGSLPSPFLVFYFNPHDFDRMLSDATGILGWSSEQFWASTAHELHLALEGYGRREEYEWQRTAQLAAWIINGTRAAYHAKRMRPVKATDLYKRKQKTARNRDAEKAARQRLLGVKEELPADFFAYKGGPPQEIVVEPKP
jgi:hypothetical protein